MSIPTPPWTVSFADGNHNRFVFRHMDEAEMPSFAYQPVTPLESSSGIYSGGDPNHGLLTPEQVSTLWSWARRVADATRDHLVDQRPMGTGMLRVHTGEETQTICFRGDTLRGLLTFVDGFR